MKLSKELYSHYWGKGWEVVENIFLKMKSSGSQSLELNWRNRNSKLRVAACIDRANWITKNDYNGEKIF